MWIVSNNLGKKQQKGAVILPLRCRIPKLQIAMKKIIILCITLVVSFAAHAQDYKNSHQYHPWNEFKSGSTPTLIDTIRFLNANFSEYHQNKYFEAKSLEKALQILDQEMPVKQIAYTVWEKDSTLQGIELIFDNRMCSKQFDQFHFFPVTLPIDIQYPNYVPYLKLTRKYRLN